MTDKHLKFLDFILPKLSEKYPDGESISSFSDDYEDEYHNKFDYSDTEHFRELYTGQYFEIYPNSDFAIITPVAKDIIDTYGSLSKYLISINQQNTKAIKRNNWITISPIVIAGLAFITSIYFGISNNNKSVVIEKFKKEVKTKDSIIIELNNKLTKNDSLDIN